MGPKTAAHYQKLVERLEWEHERVLTDNVTIDQAKRMQQNLDRTLAYAFDTLDEAPNTAHRKLLIGGIISAFANANKCILGSNV